MLAIHSTTIEELVYLLFSMLNELKPRVREGGRVRRYGGGKFSSKVGLLSKLILIELQNGRDQLAADMRIEDDL
jgi:hypothetical protein